ncbi:MAG TPA: response regulator [Roseimicrobium sp.]|nr:response regulator [Roseimicrobium sp.]
MKRRILLADDDPAVSQSLARVLESENYVVTTARSGRDTVAQFLAAPPDLIILDLNMPGGDGWHVLEKIHHFQPLQPVLVITARPHQLSRAMGTGVDALMEKPFEVPVLLDVLQRLMDEAPEDRLRRLTSADFSTAYFPGGDAVARSKNEKVATSN